MPMNQAAWLVAKHQPLEVKEAPYVEPGEGEVLVRNHALAVNPVDWMAPYLGDMAFPWIKCPFVLGSDLAGEVVAVGRGVSEVRVGDRVLAMAAGSAKQRNRAAEGAFQTYTIVLARLTTAIPDSLSFEEAAVVPLGVATAACGLFQSDLLALQRPTPVRTEQHQWLVICGGATSVGSNAIQLAVAAGYGVVTTASAKNFDYVRSLGAALVFDYNSKAVVDDMVAALEGKTLAGALSIGAGSLGTCLDVLARCRGRKFVATVSAPTSFETLFKGIRPTLPLIVNMLQITLRSNFAVWLKSRRHGITKKFYDASSVIDNDVGSFIYRDYLPWALMAGTFRPAPPPKVVGTGLEAVQSALDLQRKGVSASKVVVSLA